MKSNKKQFTVFLFVMAICFMGLKLDLESTQLGYYRPEGYNFFSTIYEEPIQDRALLIANMPAALAQAYGAQGVNLDRVDFDTADIKIWGPVLDGNDAPADRIYNVVFHPDVQRWRLNDADFNTNLFVGLFAPNGVAQAGEAIAFNTFGQINVNKHDQIYYSPNNGRFQLAPGRAIVSFWTAALSEDKTKTVIAFNVIVDQQALSDQIGDVASDSETSDEEALEQIAALVAASATISPADKQAMVDAIALIKRIKGVADQDAQERAARARQEAADRELAERLMQEEMGQQEAQRRADQAAAEQARLQAEGEQQRIQQAAAEQVRLQAEALRAQQEQERIRREQQEAADREMAERLMREQEEQLPLEDADRALVESLQQQNAAPAAPQMQLPVQQPTGQRGLSREERIAREQAAEQAAMDKLLNRKK